MPLPTTDPLSYTRTTLRTEYYCAERGVFINSITPARTDADFRTRGGSLNLIYLPTPNVAFRVKGRYLRARVAVFQHEGSFSRNYGNLTTSVVLLF